MSEKVFPSKPVPPPAATNGNNAAKAQPNPRPPQYRPQPYNHGRSTYRERSKRSICCRCVFWTVLIFLILVVLAAIACASLYALYHPRRPTFTVSSFRVHRLNFTSSPDDSTHVAALFNLTISSRNPNSRISFSYDKFSITALSSDSGVQLANGTMPAFLSAGKNENTFRGVMVSGSSDLSGDTAAKLKNDAKRAVVMKLVLDTKVVAKAGKLRSKSVGIQIACDGIRAVAPTGKSGPSLAVTSGVNCKVDLRIKIWIFTI